MRQNRPSLSRNLVVTLVTPLALVTSLAFRVAPAEAAEPAGGPAAERRPPVDAKVPERDRDTPVLRKYAVSLPWVSHLQVREERGDILAMGSRGAIVAFVGDTRENRFPTLVAGDILTALVQEGGADHPRSLFLATADGFVRHFEWGKDEPKRTFPEDELWADATIRSIALSPDGKLLAVAGDSMKVRLYETESGREVAPFLGAGAPLKGLCFTADGRRVVCGDSTGKLHAFDARDPERATTLAAHEKAVTGVAVGAGGRGGAGHSGGAGSGAGSDGGSGAGSEAGSDGDIVYSASLDGAVHATSLSTGRRVGTVRATGGPIDFFAFASSPLGEVRILAAGMDGAIALVGGPELAVLATVPFVEAGVTAAAMDPGGRSFAVACRDGTIHQWLASKLIRGDKPPRDWSRPLPIDLADYERPETRLGMKLEPAEEGGFRILGYLLGAWRNIHEGPEPGDIITHIRTGEEWVALEDLGRDVPRPVEIMEELTVRFVSRETRKTREGEVALYFSADALLEGIRGLLEGDPGYDIGVEFLWRGYVHRVDPDGAASAAGVSAGLYMELGYLNNQEAYEAVAKKIAEGKPIAVRIRKEREDSTEVVIAPKKRSEGYRLARLSVLYDRIGCAAKADELRAEALARAPEDHRVYLALLEANRLSEETIPLLEKGIESARHPTPLVDALARYLERVHQPDDALALLERWAARGPLDHKLTIVRASCLVWKAEKSVIEQILPGVTAAADRNDPEAYGIMNSILARLGRYAEGKRYLERAEEAERFGPPKGYPERPSL